MTPLQRAALFWVFLLFFIAIGIISLLVALGVFPGADPAFRRVAIGTFAAGVAGVILTLFRAAFIPPNELFVALDFQGKAVEGIDLEQQGSYEVWDEARERVSRTGAILVELGQGGWYCRLPQEVKLNDRVRFLFHERSGLEWEVRYFSPRFNKQPVVQR